jgi:hypothetical protein
MARARNLALRKMLAIGNNADAAIRRHPDVKRITAFCMRNRNDSIPRIRR